MRPIKPTSVRLAVMTAPAGVVAPFGARAECPALEQLQRAYFDAAQHIPLDITKAHPWGIPSPPSQELCESYRRPSEATQAWVAYARQHDELCRFPACCP
jgi:hypothetical protein